MTLNVSLFGKEQSTRNLIISILSNDFPLSAKQIHFQLKKVSGKSVSYQAVHKLLKEMEIERMVEKKGKGYLLSEVWIDQMENFSKQLKKAYKLGKKGISKNFYEKDQFNLSFDNCVEFGEFIIYDFFRFPNPKKKPMAAQLCHVYSSIGLTREMIYKVYKELKAKGMYVICNEDTFFNRLFRMAYSAAGVKFKLGVKCAFSCDIWVHGDHIMHIYWSPNHKKLIKKIWGSNKLTLFNLNDIYQFMHSKKLGKINITVIKNPEVAEQIRQETLAYFKGTRK